MFVSEARYNALETELKNLKEADKTKDLLDQLKEKKREIREVQKELEEVEGKLTKKFEEEKALAYKTMELDYEGKIREAVDKERTAHRNEIDKLRKEYDSKLIKSNEEHYEKLKDALAKLHEEGNANTKYIEKASLKMMDVFSQLNTGGKVNLNQLENKQDEGTESVVMDD